MLNITENKQKDLTKMDEVPSGESSRLQFQKNSSAESLTIVDAD